MFRYFPKYIDLGGSKEDITVTNPNRRGEMNVEIRNTGS
jgi:hypothetical protein